MDGIERYFAILELTPAATEEEVRRAYRDLAMVWHPDRFAHTPHLKSKAAAKMSQLSEAYAALRGHFHTRSESRAPSNAPTDDAKPSPEPNRSSDDGIPPHPHSCAFCNRHFRPGETVFDRERRPACRACKMDEYNAVASTTSDVQNGRPLAVAALAALLSVIAVAAGSRAQGRGWSGFLPELAWSSDAIGGLFGSMLAIAGVTIVLWYVVRLLGRAVSAIVKPGHADLIACMILAAGVLWFGVQGAAVEPVRPGAGGFVGPTADQPLTDSDFVAPRTARTVWDEGAELLAKERSRPTAPSAANLEAASQRSAAETIHGNASHPQKQGSFDPRNLEPIPERSAGRRRNQP
jgi:hypothetical protein